MNPGLFTCPECGSRFAGEVSPLPPHLDPASAWQAVQSGVRCRVCRFVIPLHLARRDDRMTDHRAELEWFSNYRATAPDETEALPPNRNSQSLASRLVRP